ncbi:hypothetical protein [Microbacterium trichothecenolyticum]|uniref:Sigma-like protein n=1 Tax=Microbacterium trichothecenolyticum TaxID=69370 RepID=A0ABU0TT63_MICTR|nr:hypothetical protein [Microbacterium trichothecenolyticum]MDQ1122851.1 hypothetical protein [Microbacterium trichothecenolyticum]
MSDPQNHAPGDDADDLGDDPTVKPSQETDPDEGAKAPKKDDPNADHQATGIGVIGDE